MSILKQVYFNPQNPKEFELLAYYEDKFSSFGGIVKDLLYKQMMLEKGNISIVYMRIEMRLANMQIRMMLKIIVVNKNKEGN